MCERAKAEVWIPRSESGRLGPKVSLVMRLLQDFACLLSHVGQLGERPDLAKLVLRASLDFPGLSQTPGHDVMLSILLSTYEQVMHETDMDEFEEEYI